MANQRRYFGSWDSNQSVPSSRTSSASLNHLANSFTSLDANSDDTDPILDILNGSNESSSSSGQGLDDLSDELIGSAKGLASGSSARSLHLGEDGNFISRPTSRAPSPQPGQSSSKSATHTHIHHHYHHASARRAVQSASTSAEHVPDFFVSETYRSSNLARKLGFANSASDSSLPQYKRRQPPSASKWWSSRKPRRRDSNLKDVAPPSYAMIDSSGQGSPSASTSFLESSTIPNSKWVRQTAFSECLARLHRSPWVPTQPLSILFTLVLIISFLVSTTTLTVHILNNDKAPLPWRRFCLEQTPFPHDLADSLAPVNVFVGVFSVDASYERRHLIRSTYVRHSRAIDARTGQPAQNIQVKFILGHPRKTHARRVALEMETYNDIVVLDMKENMNKGKTHAYFSWAAENATIPFYYQLADQPNQVGVGFRKADYVVKADDDAFLVLSELERHLRVSPRQGTYWGYLVRDLFMAGEAYALSSDLVDYIASYAPLTDFVAGSEDKRVARWMRMHPNATSLNWVTDKCWMYDHPKSGTIYSHGFLFPDQVERMRLEQLRGLSEEEKQRRGGAWSDSWSSVTTWKRSYQSPSLRMSMEEEVEALVEGGGMFGPEDTFKLARLPKEQYFDYSKIRFESSDARIANLTGLPNSVESRAQSQANSPAFRYNKVPHDLIRDLEDPLFKTATDAEALPPNNKPTIPIPKQNHAQLPSGEVPDYERLEPPPMMRYDASRMTLRQRRLLGLPHGGTIVVHFLKRNEWFMEAALVLLGRQQFWDSGIDAPALSVSASSAVPALSQPVPSLKQWDGKAPIKLVEPMWGLPRMYGSPIVRDNGYIEEGREVGFERANRLPVEGPANGRPGKLRGRPRLGYADPTESVIGSQEGTELGSATNSESSTTVDSPEGSASLSATDSSLQVSTTTTLSSPPLVIQPGH